MSLALSQRLRTDRSFGRLYSNHVADVYRYALAICRNSQDAEDVTQTTFLNAYRAVRAGGQPPASKNWLLAIAHSMLRQRFRQTTRPPDDDVVAANISAAFGYSAEDIRRALRELAFNHRSALVMRELEGRSYAEIAELLGLSTGALETVIFSARRALREQLDASLRCREAELAVSRQLDGRLSRGQERALEDHLRSCGDCESFAQAQRSLRAALKELAAVPVPPSLASLCGPRHPRKFPARAASQRKGRALVPTRSRVLDAAPGHFPAVTRRFAIVRAWESSTDAMR
jgi:RNA polymerase sigma factor (sigma-70 family)